MRLLASFSEVELEKFESQHHDLASAYQDEQTLHTCLNNCTDCSTVGEAWHLLGGNFALHFDFSGGLTTVFPSTAAVENDFSRFKRKKNEFRSAVTDVLLKASAL
jgi:hypothetical protein